MNSIFDDNKQFFLNSYKHIVKVNGKYELQAAYELGEDDKLKKCNPSSNNTCSHNCSKCSYYSNDNCLLRTELENCKPNSYIPCSYVAQCDAYSPIEPLNIINSEIEIIEFIEKVKNLFDCPEDYESYFGFERKWDEETGEILESTLEYYNRGGKFTKIPTQFPCVIYFGVVDFEGGREYNDELNWIYIGQ